MAYGVARPTDLRAVACAVVLHLVAAVLLARTETLGVPLLVALLAWMFWNAVWVAVLRRPIVAAAVALACLVVLIGLSRFKHDVLLMTVNFVDLMLIDKDTFLFLMQVFPRLGLKAALAAVAAIGVLAWLWRLDPWRLGRRRACAAAALSATALIGVAAVVPSDPWAEFYAENYFSKYMRSAVTATNDLSRAASSTRRQAPSRGWRPCRSSRARSTSRRTSS